MHKIGRAEFSKTSERFGSGINRLVENLLGNSSSRLAIVDAKQFGSVAPHSGTAGATMTAISS